MTRFFLFLPFLFLAEDAFGMGRNALFAMQAFSATNLNPGVAI